jgi:hypothetical protein
MTFMGRVNGLTVTASLTAAAAAACSASSNGLAGGGVDAGAGGAGGVLHDTGPEALLISYRVGGSLSARGFN